MAEAEHNATFEAGPSGHVNDEKVQLVYTRVRDTAPLDYTYGALKASIEAEQRFFGLDKGEGDDASAYDERVLARAGRYLDWLRFNEVAS